jgi:hypothetical protein
VGWPAVEHYLATARATLYDGASRWIDRCTNVAGASLIRTPPSPFHARTHNYSRRPPRVRRLRFPASAVPDEYQRGEGAGAGLGADPLAVLQPPGRP